MFVTKNENEIALPQFGYVGHRMSKN